MPILGRALINNEIAIFLLFYDKGIIIVIRHSIPVSQQQMNYLEVISMSKAFSIINGRKRGARDVLLTMLNMSANLSPMLQVNSESWATFSATDLAETGCSLITFQTRLVSAHHMQESRRWWAVRD